jgi:hypothetical protein
MCTYILKGTKSQGLIRCKLLPAPSLIQKVMCMGRVGPSDPPLLEVPRHKGGTPSDRHWKTRKGQRLCPSPL